MWPLWIGGFASIVCLLVLADGVFRIANAITSLETCIQQIADELHPDSEIEDTF